MFSSKRRGASGKIIMGSSSSSSCPDSIRSAELVKLSSIGGGNLLEKLNIEG